MCVVILRFNKNELSHTCIIVYTYIQNHTNRYTVWNIILQYIFTARRLVLPGDLQGRSRHGGDDDDDDDDDD